MRSTIFFLFLIGSVGALNAQIQRIEPANWWVGMKYNKLQLMVYGENINALSPEFDGKGITINKVHKVDNPNYLFIDIEIAPTAEAGNRQLIFQRSGNTVESFNYELRERERKAEEFEGFNSTDVIYLITPDRFANGNKGNDNSKVMKERINRENPGGRHGGDIAGIDKNLDYIKDLGFSCVWINPLLENDMEEFSYHGYSTTDFYKVDPRYGSNKEYKKLVQNAHDRDMKVIMDMIANHCGSNHWWMNDLPMQDWINQWDEYTQTSHRKITVVDPYASQRDKDVYEKGWFVKTMPDLNQANPYMSKYLIQNSIWWVEFLGLNGIRMDTYSYSDKDFLTEWTKAIMTEYPNFNIVGEEWFNKPTFVSYWQVDKENFDGYTSYLKTLCDFPMKFTLVDALNNEESFGEGLIEIYELLGHDYLYAHPENLLTFPDNHDISRIYTALNEDYDLYKMAIAFIATTRGIPMFYYGTEILMTNPGTEDHGVIRSDFPGGWKGDEVSGFSGKGLTKQQLDAQNYMRKLLKWRSTSEAVQNGSLMHFEVHEGVYVYFRYSESEKVMFLMNKNSSNSVVPLTEYAEMLVGETSGTDPLTGKKYSLTKPIKVAGKSLTIIEID
ncbi:MAG: glycoside hydrolase family 13 protein [Bacteroidia bacterium]